MKLVSISLYKVTPPGAGQSRSRVGEGQQDPNAPIILCQAQELSSFGYFYRNGVKEMTVFFGRTFVAQTRPGTRQSIKHQEYNCHVYVAPDGIGGVIFADEEYPPRVCFTLLNKLFDEFRNQYKAGQWKKATTDLACPFPKLDNDIKKYQDPHAADSLMKIMKDLDDTKVILHNTIDSALERGQKLDDLIDKSNDLSGMSKSFFKTAKDANKCSCMIL